MGDVFCKAWVMRVWDDSVTLARGLIWGEVLSGREGVRVVVDFSTIRCDFERYRFGMGRVGEDGLDRSDRRVVERLDRRERLG